MARAERFKNKETHDAMFHLCVYYEEEFKQAKDYLDLSRIVMRFHDSVENQVEILNSSNDLHDRLFGRLLQSSLYRIDLDELEAQLIACKERGLPMGTVTLFDKLYVE